MNLVTKHIIRFIILWILQVLIFNQLEFGFGIHMMIYPLFIMLLPFDLGILSLLLYAFLLGLSIDIFSNTYGLHASSLLMMAYFRPIIFNFFPGQAVILKVTMFFFAHKFRVHFYTI